VYFTVYKTTCLINNKIYIGVHKTKKPYDSYLGSGKLILYAIKKYGKENFTKEILFIFDNKLDMFKKEIELVTEDFCLREDTYNMFPGGSGGCKLNPEKRKEMGLKNIKIIHKKNEQTNHYKRLGQLNAKRIKGTKNKMHSERMKKIHKETPMLWWNNGSENKRSHVSPGDTWVRGRLAKRIDL
jgi:hypothetical protein